MAVMYFKNLLILFVVPLVLMYAPSLCLTLFIPEYCFLFGFASSLWSKRNSYHAIALLDVDFNDLSAWEIWLEYSKLQAFKRLYTILAKRGFSWKNLIWGMVIYFFGIPLRFLKLLRYLWNNPNNLRQALVILHCRSYWPIQNFKIEIHNNCIHLNCFTVGRFVYNLFRTGASKKDILRTYIIVKQTNKEFIDFEGSKKEETILKQMSFYDDNDNNIQRLHFGLVEKKTTLHATSKIPMNIVQSGKNKQHIEPAMVAMTREGSKRPCTIITENVSNIEYGEKTKTIPKIQVDSIMYLHSNLFEVDIKSIQYFAHKKTTFGAIFTSFLQEKYQKLDDEFLKEVANGNYANALEISNEYEVMDMIENLK